MIKKIAYAIGLSSILLLVLLQNDSWVKQSIAASIKTNVEKTYGTLFTGTVEHLNFFSPTCELVNVTMKPMNDPHWQWQAERLTLQCSWWHLLWYQNIDLYITIEELEAFSIKEKNKIAITDHIYSLFSGQKTIIPVIIKSLTFKPASIAIQDTQSTEHLFFKWESESKRLDSVVKTNAYFLDGKISRAGTDYVQDLTGTLGLESSLITLNIYETGTIKITGTSSYFSPTCEPYLLTGSWADNTGSCTLKNRDQSCLIDLYNIRASPTDITTTIQATLPVSSCAQHLFPDLPLTGIAHIKGDLAINSIGIQTARGTLSLDDAAWHNHCALKKAVSSFEKNGSLWHGSIKLFSDDHFTAQSSWQWDEALSTGGFHATLAHSLSIPGAPEWSINAEQTFFLFKQDSPGIFSGSYRIDASKNKSLDQTVATGTFSAKNKTLHLAGTLNDNSYEASGSLSGPYLTKLWYKDKANRTHVHLAPAPTDPQAIQGFITIDLLNDIGSTYGGYPLLAHRQEGALHLHATYGDTLKTQVHLADAVIRIPHLYNFVKEFDALIEGDLKNKKISIHDMHCSLDRGSITCNHATFNFDDQYNLFFAHVPIHLHECFLNVSKNLFAVVSAHLVATKKQHAIPHLKGSLIIERSQLKENIFSELFQKNIFQFTERALTISGMDMTCDLSLETTAPVRIKTSVLETSARISLAVRNTIRRPTFSGTINLGAGSLHFPYKSLYITKGSLYCPPNQTYDPIIELVAKNKIKKYNVTLQVSGSLRNHHIMLESTPPLTEEQIIGLLLTGSPEESLNVAMPALIMNNLTSLIFGNTQSDDSLDNAFKRLFKPFDNVHLVPSFTDQTGRGGLRGAIEIDINDRWHALIQKNFSLSEDTRLELEYLLSDDISIRGIRNERRDIGGEVEMRWKF